MELFLIIFLLFIAVIIVAALTTDMSEPVFAVRTVFYCTNCGNLTPKRMKICVSCGAKPTGHRKYCRNCGIALNPEQVVCVNCKANITDTIDRQGAWAVLALFGGLAIGILGLFFIPILGIACIIIAVANFLLALVKMIRK